MQSVMNRNRALITLVVTGLAFGLACGAASKTPPKPEKPQSIEEPQDPEVSHDVSLDAGDGEPLSYTERRPWRPVRVVSVKRGDGIKFVVGGLSAWILIPDGNLERGKGGTDWCVTDSYIAFKVEKGMATVVVPENYPDPGEDTEVHYSVLATDGTTWDYVHAESPPRIIIPKR